MLIFVNLFYFDIFVIQYFICFGVLLSYWLCIQDWIFEFLQFEVCNTYCYFKGIDRPFELRGESRLIQSVMANWRLGNFFYLILKGLHHNISKKTFGRRLIISKVTLTGQSHFMLIFLTPHKVNLRIFARKHKLKIRQMNPTVHCTVYTETTYRVSLWNHTSRIPNRIKCLP